MQLESHTHTPEQNDVSFHVCQMGWSKLGLSMSSGSQNLPTCSVPFVYYGVSVLRQWFLNFILLYSSLVKYFWALLLWVYLSIICIYIFSSYIILLVKLILLLTSLFFLILLYNTILFLPYMNPPRVYTCSPSWAPSHLPPHTISLGHPNAPAPSILYPASNLDWRFISHMTLYVFQCHSPKWSHPRPLPQSPKDCSIHLCLFCCLTYRVIITIFLNSIYMR